MVVLIDVVCCGKAHIFVVLHPTYVVHSISLMFCVKGIKWLEHNIRQPSTRISGLAYVHSFSCGRISVVCPCGKPVCGTHITSGQEYDYRYWK